LIEGCSSGPRIIVGSKNFTEQVILGEILAQHLERSMDISIERRLNLGGTLLAHEALKSGGIDLYPEYTGTALTAVLKQTVSKDAEAVLSKVREGYRQWRLTWLDPLGFNNTFAMAVRSDVARRSNLNTLSDAARRSEPWLMGVGYEFTQRPDGLNGLLETYRLRLKDNPVTMDLGLLYPALESGKVEMAAANSTDGQLARAEFTVLADDRGYFPPYQCAVVTRDETLQQYPQLRAVLQKLSGRFSELEMRRLNAAVDGDKRPVAEVARDFLSHGVQ
jgi:glycine betaine/choline ABC-type transport system substrate-binding protein